MVSDGHRLSVSAYRALTQTELLDRLVRREDGGHGHQHDLHVEPQREVLDVVVVPFHAVRERRLATQPEYLRPPGDASLHAMALAIAVDRLVEPRHVLRALRPRPDEAHLAAEHVEELRQLVERRLAEELPDSRPPVDS